MTTVTYSVPEANLRPLRDRLDKLNRRALRLGMEPVVMTVDTENPKKVTLRSESGVKRVVLYFPVTIVGAPIVEAGWHFVATLHHEGEGETLVAALPGETIPTAYRWANNVCDHCGAARRRNATFLIRHEADPSCLMQVGRNCLRDFLPSSGRDPQALARWAELWGAFWVDASGAEEEGWGGAGAGDPIWALDTFLSVSSLIIRRCGWTSRGKARDNGTVATADLVLNYLVPGADEDSRRWLRDMGPVEEADKARAEKVVEWAEKALLADDERLSDYEHNLSVVVRLGIVRGRHVGLAASMISAWQRATGAETEAKTSALPSAHIAEEGARIRLHNVQVLFTKEMEDRGWGASLLVKLLHDGRNVLTWFASASAAWPETGTRINLKGTVKAHSSYKGTAETALTRVVWSALSEAEEDGEAVEKGKVDFDDWKKEA